VLLLPTLLAGILVAGIIVTYQTGVVAEREYRGNLLLATRVAAAAWSDLAAAFARAAEAIEAAKGSAKIAAVSAAEAATAERARSLHYAERALRDAIAAAID
jgi:hypothetical protein